MKPLLNILKFILIIILLGAIFWYLFGADGPFKDSQISEYCGQFLPFYKEEEQVQPQEPQEPQELETTKPVESESSKEVEPPKDLTASIVFTGDVELSEAVQARYTSDGITGVVDSSICSIMQDATVCMINNEFCFSTRGEKAADKQYTFRVNPEYVNILTDLGVDIAGLANNHVLDFGKDALADTFDTLTNANIEYTGAGVDLDESAKLIIKTDEAGRKYGFLAASRVIPFGSWNVENSQPGVFTCYDDTKLVEQVKNARSQVDFLYVCVHWGVEHTIELEAHQTQIGHDLIDAGADAVVGMHSHCLQPVEMYNNKPIFYSLGNFIFNENIKSGGAVVLTYDENSNVTIKLIPTVASGACTKPAVLSRPEIFTEIQNMSSTIQIDANGVITAR